MSKLFEDMLADFEEAVQKGNAKDIRQHIIEFVEDLEHETHITN